MPRRTRSRIDWIIVAISLIAFFFSAFATNLEKGLFVGAAVFVFGTIIQTKSETRMESLRERRFWLLITALAIVHIIVLSLVRIPELQFGLVVLPFALVDGFAMWWLINWVERNFPATNDPDFKGR